MNISDLADLICDTVNKNDATHIALCKKFINQRYKMMVENDFWKDLLITYAITTSDRIIIFPAKVEEVAAVKYDNTHIQPTSLFTQIVVDPDSFDNTSSALRFAPLPQIGVAVLPQTAGEDISIVSDAAGDTTQKVVIFGELAGAEQRFEGTLNGTTPITTSLSWDLPITVSKEQTTGTIIFTGATSSNVLVNLWPKETRRHHPRIQFFDKPSESEAMLALCKRSVKELFSDADVPIIKGIDLALEKYALGDMYRRLRHINKANDAWKEALALHAMAKEEQLWHGTHQMQVIPADTSSVGYSDANSWLT